MLSLQCDLQTNQQLGIRTQPNAREVNTENKESPLVVTKRSKHEKNYSFLKIGMVALFLMCCQLGHAQTWNEMVNWLQSSNGMSTLAMLAHTSDGQKSNVEYKFVRSNSEEVVIKITYEGWFSSYTDTYTIKKGTYNGKPYFRRILIDEVWDPVTGAFMGIDRFGLGYALVYNGIPFSRLYGDVDFANLSRGEKGAYALFAYFLEYYY